MRAWILIPLLMAMFAGCVDAGEPVGGRGPTAQDAIRISSDAAKAWDAGAQLVGLAGYESGTNESDGPGLPTAYQYADGHGLNWHVYWQNGDGQMLNVTVLGSGALGEQHEDGAGSDVAPGPLKMDSPTVMDVVRAQADNASAVITPTSAFEVYAMYNVDEEEDFIGVGWHWVLVVASEAQLHFYAVSDANQTLVADFDVSGYLFAFWPPESGTFSGQVTAAQTAATHSFEIGRDFNAMNVVLEVQQADPLARVVLQLTGPNGTTLEATANPQLNPGDARFELVNITAGTYTAQVQLDGGAVARYRLDYCTSGFAFPISFGLDENACSRAWS
jgi:hypothetical protein